ncbi:TonB-dependent receptor, partial [human gut metagenome]
YFIQDEWKFAPKWTVTPGIRVDHHSSFGTHTSPSISLGYDVNERQMCMLRIKSTS